MIRHPPNRPSSHRTPTRHGMERPYPTVTMPPADHPAPGGAPSGTPILWLSCERARVAIAQGGQQHGNDGGNIPPGDRVTAAPRRVLIWTSQP